MPHFDFCDRCKDTVNHPVHLFTPVRNDAEADAIRKMRFESRLLKMRKGIEPTDIKWISSSKEGHRIFAVPAGIDSSTKQYVARAIACGGLIPGKLPADEDSVYVGYGGRQFVSSNYEILVAPPGALSWVPCLGSRVPRNAISGGHDPNGDAYFIGRAIHNGTWTVGKVHPYRQGCYVVHSGKEHYYGSYEILCRNAYYKAVTSTDKLEGPPRADCMLI